MNNQMDYENEYFGGNGFFDEDQDNVSSLNLLFHHKNSSPYKLNQLHQQLPVNPDSFPFEVQKKQQKEEATKDVADKRTADTENQLQPVPKAKIIFGDKINKKYRQTYKGGKDDTMELNINFKTLLVHYFKQLIMLNQLSEQEIKHVNDFRTRLPSFNSLMQFYQKNEANEGIRSKCLELFSSAECIRRVMSGRSRLKTKLQMIKYIQKMRLNLENNGTVYKWKDIKKI